MRSTISVFCVVCVALAAAVVLPMAARAASGSVRIGTYDNRVIAIAYAQAGYIPVAEKTAEYDRAEAAGDTATMREIDDFMSALQRKLHRQGFGRVPVDDLLEPVALQIPSLAADLGLHAIVWICDYAGEGVEVVDVSEELARLYVSSEDAAELCREVIPVAPVDLDEIDHVE